MSKILNAPITRTLSHYHGAAELWYNMRVFESQGKRVGGIVLYHSWKTRNCVLCFNRKTGNLRRGRICGIAECFKVLCVPYSVFRQGYSSASIEIQSGVRFFMFGRAENKESVYRVNWNEREVDNAVKRCRVFRVKERGEINLQCKSACESLL